jgi:hypothetical protein
MPRKMPPPDALAPMDHAEPAGDDTQTESGPQGYMLALKVRPDGTMAACKKPLEEEPEATDVSADGRPASTADYDEVEVDSIEQGLKAILKLYKDNPIEQTEDAGMNAGFAAETPPPQAPVPKGY